MLDDIKKPTPRPPQQPITDEHHLLEPAGLPVLEPTVAEPTGLTPPKKSKKRLIWSIITIIGVVCIGIITASLLWYNAQLKPVTSNTSELSLVTIESGATPDQIATTLKEKKLIRSTFAFGIYTRLSNTRGSLQAGTYRLSGGESMQQIVGHLTNGNIDKFTITFLPGATLADHRKVLVDAGYPEAEVDAGLQETYDSPIFAGKPATADLEGYIYGETYQFGTGATVQEILQFTFDQFATVIEENDLVAGFTARGLTLYEGITLASIVQREVRASVSADPTSDQKQVAQVFHTRLSSGMPLGSDVTFIYAANKLGVTPISTLDSPYNTRIVVGLPPGPIASPGVSALRATANPANGDFVYFVAGDDGKTYFGRTLEEHESNVAKYCTVECDKP